MHNINEKGVLITGAGRGIGKRLALGFAAEGARIGLIARTKAELDLTNLEIEHNGGVSLRLRASVTDYEQICASIDRMRTHFGVLDVLICSAGVQGPISPLAETAPKAWIEAIETNLIGTMNAMRAVLPHMIDKRAGKIIVMSGRGGADPRPNFSAYAASKAGLVRLVETVAEEVREHNIQVNAMTPGGSYTSMTDEILKAGDRAGWKEQEDAMQVRLTGGITPERQVQLALFLASPASNHISGKLIHVNDDWKRLERDNISPELFTLRRVQKGGDFGKTGESR